MGRFDTTIGVRIDEVGSLIDDLTKRVQAGEDAAAQASIPGTDLPFVDTTFAPQYDRTNKKHVYVTLRFGIPGNTFKLHIVLIERALGATLQGYKQNRVKVTLAQAIEDEDRSAQSITDRVDTGLKYSTMYDIVRLIAEDEQGDTVANPTNTNYAPTDTEPLGYPGNVLFTFTTPERFGAPSSPTLADIFTDLDPTTPEYDAYALLTQHAPTHPETGANQSFRAAGVDWVQAVLTRAYPTGTEQFPFKSLLTDAELDAVDGSGRGICKVKATGLHPGGSYTWTENTVHTVDGKRTATGSIDFRAAHQDTNLGLLGNVALTAVTSGEFGSKRVQINLEFSQPSGPTTDIVTLKNFTLKLKRSTVADFDNVVDRGNLVQADAYHRVNLAAGVASITIGTNALNGTGCDFTKFQEGWKVKVGGQTFTLKSIISAFSATTTANATATVASQPFVVVIVIPLKVVDVQPLLTYNVRVLLRSRAETIITINQTFSTGSSGEVLIDTAAPSGLNQPKLWFKRGKLKMTMSMAGLTNITSLATVEAQIGTPFFSLNLDDLDSDVAVAGTVFYQTGRDDCQVNTPISLKQAKRIWGDVQLTGFFRLTNSIGQTTSLPSNALSTLSGLADYSPNTGFDNKLWNGDFTNDDGVTSTVLGNWINYNPETGSLSNPITTSSTRAQWDQARHLAFFRQNDTSTNLRYIVQNLFKTEVHEDFNSFSFFVSSNSSISATLDVLLASIFDLTGTWTTTAGSRIVTRTGGAAGAALTEVKLGTVVGANAEVRTVDQIISNDQFQVSLAFTGTAAGLTVHACVPRVIAPVSITGQTFTLTPKYIEVTMQNDISQGPTDPLDAKDIYVVFRTPTTISSSGPYLEVGRVMMVSGKTSSQFARKNLKERNTSSTGLSAGSPVASENLSFVPQTGIGGERQDQSGARGDLPDPGGYIVQ